MGGVATDKGGRRNSSLHTVWFPGQIKKGFSNSNELFANSNEILSNVETAQETKN